MLGRILITLGSSLAAVCEPSLLSSPPRTSGIPELFSPSPMMSAVSGAPLQPQRVEDIVRYWRRAFLHLLLEYYLYYILIKNWSNSVTNLYYNYFIKNSLMNIRRPSIYSNKVQLKFKYYNTCFLNGGSCINNSTLKKGWGQDWGQRPLALKANALSNYAMWLPIGINIKSFK